MYIDKHENTFFLFCTIKLMLFLITINQRKFIILMLFKKTLNPSHKNGYKNIFISLFFLSARSLNLLIFNENPFFMFFCIPRESCSNFRLNINMLRNYFFYPALFGNGIEKSVGEIFYLCGDENIIY